VGGQQQEDKGGEHFFPFLIFMRVRWSAGACAFACAALMRFLDLEALSAFCSCSVCQATLALVTFKECAIGGGLSSSNVALVQFPN
jgi:hypothetical protein